MSILTRIREFIHHCERHCQELGFIPLSRAELTEIDRECGMLPIYGEKATEVFGYKVWETDYAPAIMERVKTIDLPVCRYEESVRVDMASAAVIKTEDYITGHLRYNLEKHICTDDTHLTLTVVCDPWQKLKERVKWIGKRWPVRKQQFKVDGKVLYPYLNVTFPLNRHAVKWRVVCK